MLKKNLLTFLYAGIPFALMLTFSLLFVNLDFCYQIKSGEYTTDMFLNNEGGLDVVMLDILLLIVLYITALRFWRVYHAANKVEDHEDGIKPGTNAVTCAHGAPGTGKSSSTGYDAVVSARIFEFELRWKYKLYSYKVKAGTLTPEDAQTWADWLNVKESYEFYDAHPDNVWCLASNVPIQVGNKYSYELLYEHSTQEKRLPLYTVLYYDEAGAVFDNLMSRTKGKKDTNKILEVSDFYRLIRHFGYCAYLCEQSETGVFKDVRNVTAVNRIFNQQAGVGQAKLLKKWLNKIQEKYALPGKEKKLLTRKDVQRVGKLSYLIAHIGFRRYVYRDIGNTESTTSNLNITGQKIMYLPSHLNYTYDDRCFRNLLLCLNKDIDLDIWDVMTIPAGDTKYLHSRFATEPEEDKQPKKNKT